MLNKVLIVVVALLSATLVAGLALEKHFRSQGLTDYDKVQLRRLIDDINR